MKETPVNPIDPATSNCSSSNGTTLPMTKSMLELFSPFCDTFEGTNENALSCTEEFYNKKKTDICSNVNAENKVPPAKLETNVELPDGNIISSDTEESQQNVNHKVMDSEHDSTKLNNDCTGNNYSHCTDTDNPLENKGDTKLKGSSTYVSGYLSEQQNSDVLNIDSLEKDQHSDNKIEDAAATDPQLSNNNTKNDDSDTVSYQNSLETCLSEKSNSQLSEKIIDPCGSGGENSELSPEVHTVNVTCDTSTNVSVEKHLVPEEIDSAIISKSDKEGAIVDKSVVNDCIHKIKEFDKNNASQEKTSSIAKATSSKLETCHRENNCSLENIRSSNLDDCKIKNDIADLIDKCDSGDKHESSPVQTSCSEIEVTQNVSADIKISMEGKCTIHENSAIATENAIFNSKISDVTHNISDINENNKYPISSVISFETQESTSKNIDSSCKSNNIIENEKNLVDQVLENTFVSSESRSTVNKVQGSSLTMVNFEIAHNEKVNFKNTDPNKLVKMNAEKNENSLESNYLILIIKQKRKSESSKDDETVEQKRTKLDTKSFDKSSSDIEIIGKKNCDISPNSSSTPDVEIIEIDCEDITSKKVTEATGVNITLGK